MLTTLRVLEALVGVALVFAALDAMVRTFLLPRGVSVAGTRLVGLTLGALFSAAGHAVHRYETRDRVLALYGPIYVLSLLVAGLLGAGLGYSLLFHAATDLDWRSSVRMSGSALFTLGFAAPDSSAQTALVFSEAALGLILIAFLIAYLPTIYGAFSRRELLVSQLSVRAGAPPSPVGLLVRAHRTDYLPLLDPFFAQWEVWFDELDETHSSLAILSYFRSPRPDRSWVVAAGVVLDSAALRLALIDLPPSPQAAVTIRSGYVALRSVADVSQIPYDSDPRPGDPISVTREEFDEVADRLSAAGVPLKADRDRAWAAFAGWRVNYDAVLRTIAGMVMAPPAPWISDQPPTERYRPPLRQRRAARLNAAQDAARHAARDGNGS